MEQDLQESALAVYLHIPFCLSKCGYCSFFSEAYNSAKIQNYITDLKREIKLYQSLFPVTNTADTIYFGGGSPSLLPADEISEICGSFGYCADAEISLEINPIQITPAYLTSLSKTPVNRLSLGLQSRLDGELDFLERKHRDQDTASRIQLLRDFGYDNFSLDLIYGLPGSNLEDLQRNLEGYLELAPRHISTYLLSLDESSLWQRSNSDKARAVQAVDEDFLADSYALISKRLTEAGYLHYEISNFAHPGYESRHNLHYWQSDDYLGLGASATGFLEGVRYNNPADLAEYARNLDEGELRPDRELADNLKMDYIIMGLRTAKGIDRQKSIQALGVDLWQEKAETLARLEALGLIIRDEERLALCPEAYFISNAVIGELI